LEVYSVLWLALGKTKPPGKSRQLRARAFQATGFCLFLLFSLRRTGDRTYSVSMCYLYPGIFSAIQSAYGTIGASVHLLTEDRGTKSIALRRELHIQETKYGIDNLQSLKLKDHPQPETNGCWCQTAGYKCSVRTKLYEYPALTIVDIGERPGRPLLHSVFVLI